MAIRFDLSSASFDPILAATLSLKNLGPASLDGSSFAIYKITDSWSVSTVAWNNKASVGPRLGTATLTDGWLVFDVTSSVKGFVNDPSSNHGFEISRCVNMATETDVASSEYSNQEFRPKLIVTTDNTSINNTKNLTNNNHPFIVRCKGGIISVFIPFDNVSEISIFDAIGRTVYNSGNAAGNSWLQLVPKLSTGIHVLQVKAVGNTFYSQIFIE